MNDRTTCCRDIEAVICDSYIICRQKSKRRLLFYWVTYFWSRCVWVDNWINRIIKNNWRCTLCSHYWLCYIEWTKSRIHRRRRLRDIYVFTSCNVTESQVLPPEGIFMLSLCYRRVIITNINSEAHIHISAWFTSWLRLTKVPMKTSSKLLLLCLEMTSITSYSQRWPDHLTF